MAQYSTVQYTWYIQYSVQYTPSRKLSINLAAAKIAGGYQQIPRTIGSTIHHAQTVSLSVHCRVTDTQGLDCCVPAVATWSLHRQIELCRPPQLDGLLVEWYPSRQKLLARGLCPLPPASVPWSVLWLVMLTCSSRMASTNTSKGEGCGLIGWTLGWGGGDHNPSAMALSPVTIVWRVCWVGWMSDQSAWYISL